MTDPASQMVQRFDPNEAQFQSYPLDPETVLEGDPKLQLSISWTNEDTTFMMGAMRCTPGRFQYTQSVDGTSYVLSGHIVMKGSDGSVADCGPGTQYRWKAGAVTEYDISGDYLEVFVAASADGVHL